MPTAIEALAKDGSGGGLTGEPREHELCAFSYDSSDEPTEVIVLIKNEAGDESSEEERTGASKSIDPLLNGSESSSAPTVMDNSPSRNITKTDFGFGLTDDNNYAKLTRQHVIQGAGSKENASPQKEVNEVNEVNTGTFAPLGCTKAALFGSGGGSNNPSSRTLMNDVKDTSTSGNIITTAEKAGAGIEEAVVSGGSHDQAARGNAPKERDGDLFRDIKERGNATGMTLMEKTTSDESIRGDNRQGRELDEVKSALSNHTSALLMLLRQTAAKGEKCVPAVLLNPVREETMTALRNANFRFPLSSALSDAENDALRLFTEEIRQRKKEKQQQQQQSLETMNDESSDQEGQCETKSVLASASANKAGVTSKRPRSDKESENGQDNKRTKNQCMSEGCENNVIKGGVCWRHGAKAFAKQCSNEGCKNGAVKGGVCWRHGAKKKCSSDGCMNQAIKGGVCWRHGAKAYVKLCSSEGCTNRSIQGGVCLRHGATKKLCSREGCTKQAKKGGVCIRHG